MSKVKITETVLRDAHQSLIATRMTTEEMLPILEKLDIVGYHSLEMWGGATFDAAMRFLNEDPWERLRIIRKNVKNTKLQMLLRGQNILGYKHYPDDVVVEFVKKSVANGIDIIRVFDALNDIRNLKVAMETAKKEGAHAQAAISYTISPAHTTDTFVQLAKNMEELGADSICIKDMSGLLTPYYAYELITELKKAVKVPLQLHSHSTSGLASMTYLKGIEAGVDIVDTAISPFSLGTSQPPTESIVATLKTEKSSQFTNKFGLYRFSVLAFSSTSVTTPEPTALSLKASFGTLDRSVFALSSKVFATFPKASFTVSVAAISEIEAALEYPVKFNLAIV